MAALSDYLENKLIDHLFRGTPYSPPAGLYLALFTASPADPGGGAEVAGGSYARVGLAPSASNWQDTAGGTAATSSGETGTTKNAVRVDFPTATAGWGTVVAFGVFDAASGGNLLVYGALSASQAVVSGQAPFFAAGSLSVQIDG